MARMFGTDGVRGVANAELTPELCFRLGRAVTAFLGAGGERPRLLVGRDTRRSGPMLEAALVSGIASAGGEAVRLGVMTTPGVAALVRRRRAAGGAVISASHNPAEYNGVKFFGPDGFKLPDAAEDEVERLTGRDDLPRPVGAGVGAVARDRAAGADYVDLVAGTVPGRLTGMRVVLDCAHGAAYRLAPALFRRLGAEVTVLADRPDGLNINAGCGALHPQGLQEAVRRAGADAGLAFDGDADRVIGVDERGQVVDGDHILAIAGLHLARAGRLPGGTVVATVMSNLGLERALAAAGVRLVRTPVGDRHVLEAMRQGGYALGGEQSGHVIFLEHATTGDGLVTGAQLLWIMQESGRRLSELAAAMVRYPQVLVNVRLPGARGVGDRLARSPAVGAAVAQAERALAGRGRVLVRPSGTEPVVRVMVEGEDQRQVAALADDLAAVIRRELG